MLAKLRRVTTLIAVFLAIATPVVFWLNSDALWEQRMAAKERLIQNRDKAEPLLPDGVNVAYRMVNAPGRGFWSYCYLSLWKLSPATQAALREGGLAYVETLDIGTADKV